jgi:hypothetical protein
VNTFVSYVTPAEFKTSPTAVDTSKLDQQNIGNTVAQDSVLADILRRASRWADTICRQPLYATTYTESKAINMTRDKRLVVHPNCSPLNTLVSVKYRYSPADSWTDVDTTNSIELYESWFDIYGSTILSFSTSRPTTVRYVYNAGFAVTSLAAGIATGVTSITVKDVSGIVAGSGFTIGVGYTAEFVKALAVVGNTITLTVPTVLAHNVDDNVSTVPDDIRQAVVSLAGFLIRERGSLAITMNETTLTSTSQYAKSDDVKYAVQMLKPYMRVVSS